MAADTVGRRSEALQFRSHLNTFTRGHIDSQTPGLDDAVGDLLHGVKQQKHHIHRRARTHATPPSHTHTTQWKSRQHWLQDVVRANNLPLGKAKAHLWTGGSLWPFPIPPNYNRSSFLCLRSLLPLAPPSPHPRELKKNTPSNLGIQSRPSDWTARTRLLLREGVCVRREGNRCEKTEADIENPIAAPARSQYATRPPLKYLCVLPAVRAA